MIPLRDENPTYHTPYINYILILINILVFIFQVMLGSSQDSFVYQFALIPAQFTNGISVGDITDIFTSMFMHAGFAHIAGNMLYLWIFGDNVEDAMGHGRYLFFYLLGGFTASITHILTNLGSQLPTVGASGAIAAVLGAYLVLYPQSRVTTLIFLGYFIRLAMVPAVIVLGLWFVLQLFEGVLALGAADIGGVAFWAHIGGFVTGLLFAKLLARQTTPRYVERLRW
ncbi:MAG: rhomboid family intramembrane serine protease [Anaerolineales bacterium]|nr:rhomboid family intramembrane serine protease [Anaerolineales bacterium]